MPNNQITLEDDPGQPALIWEVDVRLLGHPLIIRQLLLSAGLAGGIMALLLTFLLAVQGEWQGIPAMLLICLGAAIALALLLALVSLLAFGNRMHMRFGIGAEGVTVEVVDRRASWVNRLASLGGLVGASPSTAGAGLMALSRQGELLPWQGIVAARCDPQRRSITLHNAWRPLALLACTPENYAHVEALVRAHVGSAPEIAPKSANPLPRLLGCSLLLVLAALPVFVLPYPFELDLLAPLLMLCFALATLWLAHPLGWVVIALALWIIAQIVAIAFESHESLFAWRGTYRNYEMLNGSDWAALAVAALGLGYLAVFAWRAARGRYPAALAADEAEAKRG